MFIKSRFEILSEWISQNLGHPYAFLTASAVVVIWALVGPLLQYSDTWQLVINTGTTIVTFLMVFLLQNTGNRGIKNTDRRLEVLEQQNRMLIDQLRQLVDNTNKRGL
jgi:low affinity Fe/Cu permease